MTPGLYTIATALDSRFQVQEKIARNLANAETLGFRRTVEGFMGFGARIQKAGEHLSNDNPAGAGVRVQPDSWDQSSGALRTTGQALDLALRGPGFFVVRTPAGERLTRDGHFTRSRDGLLVNALGQPVLGRNGPIQLPEGAPTVASDGKIQVDGAVADFLRIESPAHASQLRSENGTCFFAVEGRTTPATRVDVVSGSVELSNVSVPTEMVAMIENSRMAETAAHALQILDEGIGKAVSNLAS